MTRKPSVATSGPEPAKPTYTDTPTDEADAQRATRERLGNRGCAARTGVDMSDQEAAARTISRQCEATSKRSGKRCRKNAMRGRTVCLAHGGRTPIGISSPHYKTGIHSRYLLVRGVAIMDEQRRQREAAETEYGQ